MLPALVTPENNVLSRHTGAAREHLGATRGNFGEMRGMWRTGYYVE